MASDAAKLLDELMGRDRNLAPTDKKRSAPSFEDPEVCFYYANLLTSRECASFRG